MSWWKLPLTVLGLGGVGAVVLASRSHRGAGKSAAKRFNQWNESAQRELVRLQDHLREIASAVNPEQAS